MMMASSMGAAAFQKGLGGMHAMSHPCGAVLNTHHGLTNAVVMPYVLVFNRPSVAAPLTDLARYLDLPCPGFRAVLEWVLELRGVLGIPNDLAALGVADAHVEQLAGMAAEDPSVGGNPVALTAANLAGLFGKAIHGQLDP